jgi:hypothetical protein
VSDETLVADAIVYTALMIWSWVKCVALGALIVMPFLFAWSCLVVAKAADEAKARTKQRERDW